jgi:hypothetical protein
MLKIGLEELQKELASRKKEFGVMRKLRTALLGELKALDRKMLILRTGRLKQMPKRKGLVLHKPVPTHADIKQDRIAARASVIESGKTLVQIMKDILVGAPKRKGMAIPEIREQVVKTGYVGAARKWFRTRISATLADKSFRRVSRGHYVLSGK